MDQKTFNSQVFSTAAAVLMCLFTLGVNAQQSFKENDLQKLKFLLDRYAAELNLPSYAAYVSVGDDLEWSWAYGYSNIEEDVRATALSCYQCASLTKSFASAVVMKLVEQGVLDLNEPVLPYLLPVIQQYGIAVDEKVGGIHLDHLLSHTSDHPAGSYFRYDGDRFAMLTKILYDKTGRSFEQLIKEIIIEPLGLTHTLPGTEIAGDPELAAMLAGPYDINKDMQAVKGKYTRQFNTSAGLVSNVTDLGLFVRSLQSNTILNAISRKALMDPFVLNNGCKSVYGLGWYVQECLGTRVVWNFGFGYSTSGIMMLLPDYNATFVIMSNCDMISRPFAIGLPEKSVLSSPFANAFLKSVVAAGQHGPDFPEIDWNTGAKNIQKKIAHYDDPFVVESLHGELEAQWNIARTRGDKDRQNRLLGIYERIHAGACEAQHTSEPIAGIVNVSEKGVFRDTVRINEEGLYRIMAVADGGYVKFFGMYDKVSLRNIDEEEPLWQMTAAGSRHAGGHPRNRLADLVLLLEAGTYELVYDNSVSPYRHYAGHWEAMPPNGMQLGFKMYKTNP